MATSDTNSQNTEKVYKDIIKICESRIQKLENKIEEEEEDINKSNSSKSSLEQHAFQMNVATEIENNRDFKRCMELKEDIRKCADTDLLRAFRDEFQRQLKAYQIRQLAKLTAIAPPPPPSVHRYFKDSSEANNKDILVYSHYDSSVNVRQLILTSGQSLTLILSGIDDAKLCPMKLEDMELANALGEEISESEFNTLWFSNGGFPYVRSARKARRQLSRVLFKTL